MSSAFRDDGGTLWVTLTMLVCWSGCDASSNKAKPGRDVRSTQTDPPLTADDRRAIERACTTLATDPSAGPAFPGALDYLCKGATPDCAKRHPCLADTACYERHGSSNCEPGDPGPCLPDYVFKACDPIARPRLAALIRHFSDCSRTGGSWETAPGSDRYPGACSCMGSSPEGLAWSMGGDAGIPKAPIVFFVQHRGCVAEETLCKESIGAWVPSARRPYCTLAGKPVSWETRGFQIGFRE